MVIITEMSVRKKSRSKKVKGIFFPKDYVKIHKYSFDPSYGSFVF